MLIFSIADSQVIAEIYKWTDADGNVHFSDKQPIHKKAKPVQLKAKINSYNGNAAPIFESSPSKRKSVNSTKKTKLPQLSPKQVIMYSTTWCGFCKKAKAYFRLKGISFAEKDIEKSPQAKSEYQSYGGGGVPLILVGHSKGTRKLSGFSVSNFEAIFK